MLVEDTRLLVRDEGQFITHSSEGRDSLYCTGWLSMPTLCSGGGHPLLFKAALYTNILEKIVQNKRQSVPASAQQTCRDVRDNGTLSPNSAQHAQGSWQQHEVDDISMILTLRRRKPMLWRIKGSPNWNAVRIWTSRSWSSSSHSPPPCICLTWTSGS